MNGDRTRSAGATADAFLRAMTTASRCDLAICSASVPGRSVGCLCGRRFLDGSKQSISMSLMSWATTPPQGVSSRNWLASCLCDRSPDPDKRVMVSRNAISGGFWVFRRHLSGIGVKEDVRGL